MIISWFDQKSHMQKKTVMPTLLGAYIIHSKYLIAIALICSEAVFYVVGYGLKLVST